jgi:hypothetical protein
MSFENKMLACTGIFAANSIPDHSESGSVRAGGGKRPVSRKKMILFMYEGKKRVQNTGHS